VAADNLRCYVRDNPALDTEGKSDHDVYQMYDYCETEEELHKRNLASVRRSGSVAG
jgi:hypothetical protein